MERKAPLVTVVMATSDREEMALHSIMQFLSQDYQSKELVVVDGGKKPLAMPFECPIVKVIRAGPGVALGKMMNWGVKSGSGEVIQKWDDDDVYQRGFLQRSVAAVVKNRASVWGKYGVRVMADGEGGVLRLSDGKTTAGGTLAMTRELWKLVPFRDCPSRVDSLWWEDAAAQGIRSNQVAVMDSPHLYTYIRHGRNTWRRVQAVSGGKVVEISVDDRFRSLPEWDGIPNGERGAA